jgi:hypothetical protein
MMIRQSSQSTPARREFVCERTRSPTSYSTQSKRPKKKRTDLRKLSEWIKAQRRAAEAQRTPATDSRPGKQYVLFMPVGHLTAVIASAWRKLAGTK